MADHFKDRVSTWDKGSTRVRGALTIAKAIEAQIELKDTMQIMDFGVGTGLLGFEIAKKVKKVYGVDTSANMIKKLNEKNTSSLHVEGIVQDIVKNPLDKTFDGLVSSMTLHHTQDLKLFFQTIYKNLKNGGFIAIADLEKEDGSFHSDNTGVFHFGFDIKELKDIVLSCGFKKVKIQNINTITKPHREFGIFLLTATKEN